MPKEAATEVKIVRVFFVLKFFKDKETAVKKDIEVFSFFVFFFIFIFSSLFFSSIRINFPILFSSITFLSSSFFASFSPSLESERTSPSLKVIILSLYCSASFSLWVTIITSFSWLISFKISITWTLVLLSRAPVGSSAKIISGSFTKDLAIATLCIWPPLNWLGFLL